MTSRTVLLLATLLPLTTLAGAPTAEAPKDRDTASYEVGLLLGSQLEHAGAAKELATDALVKGLKDALGGRAVTPAERDAAMAMLKNTREARANANRAQAREFLAANGKQPGVVTLPSGLQYRVLVEGDKDGESPKPTDEVTVRYRATLADGTEFDRSETHDRPAKFRVSGVFKAWQEAFSQMHRGSKWQLFVPPELGYGNNTPPQIPPGALIVYELELVAIEHPAAAPLPQPPKPSTGQP